MSQAKEGVDDKRSLPPSKGMKARAKAFFPVLQWLPNYDRKNLRFDIVAGITVGAITVPEAIAYANLAGLPPEIGLYAALLAPILYFLFATSKQLSIGPSSAISAMIALTIALLSGGDMEKAIALAGLLAIIVGSILVIFYFLRLGIISYFISDTVMTGFKAGAAFFIISSQLSKLFGMSSVNGNFFDKVGNIIVNIGQTHWPSLIFGLAGIGFLWLGSKYFHRLPNKLILVIIATIAAMLATYLGISLGMNKIGFIPDGLPSFTIPNAGLSDLADLLPLALGVVLLAIVEGVAITKTFARKHDYKVDTNKEILGWGAGNIASGFFSGYPVDASFSRSAVADESGSKTPLMNIFAVLVIGLVLVFFANFFSNMPLPIVAAVIIFAVAGLFSYPALKAIYAYDKKEFLVAFVAFMGVLFFGLLEGVLLGVLLTFLLYAYNSTRASISILGRIPNTDQYSDIERSPVNEVSPGILIFRANGPIAFTNAEKFENIIVETIRIASSPVRLVILSLATSPIGDKSTVDFIQTIYGILKKKGIDLRLADVIGESRDKLHKMSISEELGVLGPAMTIDSVIKDWQSKHGQQDNAPG